MLYSFEDLTFRILTIDRFSHKEGVFEVNARPYAAFSYRTHGTGVFDIAGKRVVTEPGDLLFLPAYQPYRVEYSVSESIVVHFAHCNYREAEIYNLTNPRRVGLLFRQLLEEWGAQHSSNRAKATIYTILEELAADKSLAPEDTAFAACVRYLKEHVYDPELTVDRVCHAGFVSASALQRAFHAHFGMAPKQYLLKLRMNRALELLAEGGHSIREIALLCGFRDEKYFSRAFKSSYGSSPSQLLQNMIV